MKSKILVIAIALFSLVLTGATASYAQQAAGRPAAAQGRHCVIQVHELPEGSDPAQLAADAPAAGAPAARCFPTFAEAVQAATGLTGGIDPNLKPGDLTDELLDSLAAAAATTGSAAPTAPAATRIIGVDYSGSNYSGSTHTWYVNNSVGCTTGISYYYSSPPSGWNDRVSSYRAYAGCVAAYHFEHANFQGAVLRCNWCSGFGAMDNRASSWLWFRTSGHY
jgi:hypothetical protein